MNATFLDEDGKPKPFEMGCYGIGITRLPAAAIEQNHDGRGIIWPDAIAPFGVVICPVGMDRSPAVKEAAESLYAELLQAGVDVLLDDRGERPGAMFADWELIGVPHRVTIGDKSLKDGQVEYQQRRDGVVVKVPVIDIAAFVQARLDGIGECDAVMKPRRSRPDVIRDWAAELSRKLGRPESQLIAEGLSADDFSFGHSVEIRRPDGSVYRSFKFAFAVFKPERKQAAVFSEHDGYVEFDLAEDAVVAEIDEDVYFQE
jgi:hypothetical protein